MTALNHAGAAAPRPVTPESDDALTGTSGQGTRGQSREDSSDCASADDERKLTTTLTVRLALLGVEAHRLADGGWLLRHAEGAGIVHGLDALAAAADHITAVQRSTHALLLRLRGAV